MEIKFSKFANSLGTRSLGLEIRSMIVNNIRTEDKIIFDFKDVEVICNSFADECFGKLISDLGLDYVKSKTTFVNANPFISLVIKKAINDRIKVNPKNLVCV